MRRRAIAGIPVGQRGFTLRAWSKHPGVLLGSIEGGPLYTAEQTLPMALSILQHRDLEDDAGASNCWARFPDKSLLMTGKFQLSSHWAVAPLSGYINQCQQLSARIAAEAGPRFNIVVDPGNPRDMFSNLFWLAQSGQPRHVDYDLGVGAHRRCVLSVILALQAAEGAGKLQVLLDSGVFVDIDEAADFVVLAPGVEHQVSI